MKPTPPLPAVRATPARAVEPPEMPAWAAPPAVERAAQQNPAPAGRRGWAVRPAAPVARKIGGSPLAPDLGAVVMNAVVVWKLPTSLAKPGQPVFVAVFPVSVDGVDYWGKKGQAPPELVVQAP